MSGVYVLFQASLPYIMWFEKATGRDKTGYPAESSLVMSRYTRDSILKLVYNPEPNFASCVDWLEWNGFLAKLGTGQENSRFIVLTFAFEIFPAGVQRRPRRFDVNGVPRVLQEPTWYAQGHPHASGRVCLCTRMQAWRKRSAVSHTKLNTHIYNWKYIKILVHVRFGWWLLRYWGII